MQNCLHLIDYKDSCSQFLNVHYVNHICFKYRSRVTKFICLDIPVFEEFSSYTTQQWFSIYVRRIRTLHLFQCILSNFLLLLQIYSSFKHEFKIMAENASRTQNYIFVFNYFDLLSQNTSHGLFSSVMKENNLLNNSMKSV